MAHDLQLHVLAAIRHHPDPLVWANCATPRPIVVGQEFLDRYPDFDMMDWIDPGPLSEVVSACRQSAAGVGENSTR